MRRNVQPLRIPDALFVQFPFYRFLVVVLQSTEEDSLRSESQLLQLPEAYEAAVV